MIRYPTRAALAAAKTVLYGGTYRYQNTYASKLELVDPALRLKHGLHAVTSNRNAIDLLAGKWLRARVNRQAPRSGIPFILVKQSK